MVSIGYFYVEIEAKIKEVITISIGIFTLNFPIGLTA